MVLTIARASPPSEPASRSQPRARGEHAEQHRDRGGEDPDGEPGREAAQRLEPDAPAERGGVEPERPHADDPGGAGRSRAAAPRPATSAKSRRRMRRRARSGRAPRVRSSANGMSKSATSRKPST